MSKVKHFFYIILSFSFMRLVADGVIVDPVFDGIVMQSDNAEQVQSDNPVQERIYSDIDSGKIYKKVLDNGLTLLVVSRLHATNVAMNLFYRVGCRHESSGERGMAHFIEHMVFKGTNTMLSEVDIPQVSTKLNAMCNAATWYDWTFYIFRSPLSNWKQFLPIFADCMQNCRFLQDHMNSEIKAIMQELAMRRDMHEGTLTEQLASEIFAFHPYHSLCIGVKQDLWNLKRDTLVNFYKKYYVPQNAVMVVVGAVSGDEVLQEVQKNFGKIPGGQAIQPASFYQEQDLQKKSVVLYRNVQQPIGALAFMIPGAAQRGHDYCLTLAELLCNHSSSRLYKKLVDELKLVSDISFDTIGTFEYDVAYIIFHLKNEKDFAFVKTIINEELQNIALHGFSQKEVVRAYKRVLLKRENDFEDVYKISLAVGMAYLAEGEKMDLFGGYATMPKDLGARLQSVVADYLCPAVCNEGLVCPVSSHDAAYAEKISEKNANKDAQELQKIVRESKTEAGRYVDTVVAHKIHKKYLPQPDCFVLENGLEVLLSHNVSVNKVNCYLAWKADHLYDPAGKEGLSTLVTKLMKEGTQKYSSAELKEEFARYGIILSDSDDSGEFAWSCLPDDLQKSLELIGDIAQHATLPEDEFEKCKDGQKVNIKAMLDDVYKFMLLQAKKLVYKNHPYARNNLGTCDSVDAISRQDCLDFYENFVSAHKAKLIIVGNFNRDDILSWIKKYFDDWQSVELEPIEYPALQKIKTEIVDIAKDQNQVCLGFVGHSVKAVDSDYIALKIFDSILIRGTSSKFFKVREQTGLFYTSFGSMVSGAWHEPGMLFIETAVAPDRVQEAYEVLMKTIINSLNSVSDEDFDSAKELEINSIVTKYEQCALRAQQLYFLSEMNLPFDYFEKQIDLLRDMKKEDMIKAVKKVIAKDKLACIRIGTFNNSENKKCRK